MAINKKLIHFNYKSKFEKELANGNILPTSIIFIRDTKEIWTHGQFYPCSKEELYKLLEGKLDKETFEEFTKDRTANVGDAVLVNKTTLEKILVPVEGLANYSKDDYEPIGVVAIPSSHDVYGTGEAGIMALMSASCTTPDTGQTSNAGITWGAYGTDYPEMMNYDEVARYGTMDNSQPSESIDGTSSFGYLPLQRSGMDVKIQCPHDSKANYYNSTSSSYGYLPSPYLEDGSRNPAYYQTESPSSTANALSDFAGKSNTEFLCSKATKQADWKTSATIKNNMSSNALEAAGYHPAACACWRFHTIGTNQGDWYLPACGELGYIAPRYDLINTTINTLQTHFGKTFCPLDTNPYWSSQKYHSTATRTVVFNYGSVYFNLRSIVCRVRPFLRANIDTFSSLKKILSDYATKSELQSVENNIKNIKVPTKTSELTNDTNYQTQTQVNEAIQKVVETLYVPEPILNIDNRNVAAGITIDGNEVNVKDITFISEEHPEYGKFKVYETGALDCKSEPIIDANTKQIVQFHHYFDGEYVSKLEVIYDLNRQDYHIDVLVNPDFSVIASIVINHNYNGGELLKVLKQVHNNVDNSIVWHIKDMNNDSEYKFEYYHYDATQPYVVCSHINFDSMTKTYYKITLDNRQITSKETSLVTIV